MGRFGCADEARGNDRLLWKDRSVEDWLDLLEYFREVKIRG